MRLVIKISGEGLQSGKERYSSAVLDQLSQQVKQLMADGHALALVVGGGNLFRGKTLSGEYGVSRATADYIGMLATVQNALVLRDFFNSHGIETRVASAIAMPQVCEEYIPKRALRHLDKGRVVIFAAGLGLPYFSTDSCAVQRALEMTADRLIMAKHGVEGVYSADPRKDAHAVLLKTVDATTAIEQGLAVADLSSLALAKENNLVIKVVSMEQLGNCLDEQTGSVVEPQ